MALKNTWAFNESFVNTDQNAVANEILGINAAGAYASRPAVGHPGRMYFCTDNGNTYRDNGTTWDLVSIGGFGLAGVEPPSTGWSTTTLGTATFAADKGGRLLTAPNVAGINARVEYRTLSPTSNYTAAICVGHQTAGNGAWESGIWLRNSASGSMVHFGLTMGSGSVGMHSYKFTNPTALAAGEYGTPLGSTALLGPINWLRFRDDGTTRFTEYSYDGIGWILFTSIGRTDFITPDQIGWGMDNQGSGLTQGIRLRSFNVTTP